MDVACSSHRVSIVYIATKLFVTEICSVYILKSYKAHREVVLIGEKRFSSSIVGINIGKANR